MREAVERAGYTSFNAYVADTVKETPAIVNEFIERINVHAPGKSSGHLDIVYNFIGMLPTSQAKKEAA